MSMQLQINFRLSTYIRTWGNPAQKEYTAMQQEVISENWIANKSLLIPARKGYLVWVVFLCSVSHVLPARADPALLIIGASYANGSTPFNDQLQAPLGGAAVGFGSYLSLGDALVRNPTTPGFVINEGQGGATTFSRLSCVGEVCGPAGWQGYPEQLEKALRRVTIPAFNDPTSVTYNARYVFVSLANDCLHSDAFGIPQNQATPCTVGEMMDAIDRLLAIADAILQNGLTPVFAKMPRYEDLNLPLSRNLFGLAWVIDEADYKLLRTIHSTHLQAKPGVLFVNDAWDGFVHRGDGLHPNPTTAENAAERILQAVYSHQIRDTD